MKTLFPIAMTVVAVLLAGCSNENSDDVQNQQQEQLAMRAADSVGMPAITKFTEKRTLKSIYELRDQEVPTWTYITDQQGHFHLVCHSVGYGVPYATKYTNPQSVDYDHTNPAPLPQADPNGLFSPAASQGSWVLCLNPETKLVSPVYIEPRIIVSPFALAADRSAPTSRDDEKAP